MPKNPKGEMTLAEIRNLAKQHNKVSVIKNIEKLSRKDLLGEIMKMGYKVDHAKRKIMKMNQKDISVAKEGEPKKQKKTLKKEARKELVKKGAKSMLMTGGGTFKEEEI
tara:strand:+ start:960 stop:1286 length:327 start_codon:yes stop_codon:yes gene_type:complete